MLIEFEFDLMMVRGFSHVLAWMGVQVAAGICAIGVFVGMLTNIASKDDFDVKEFGLSIEKGWGSVSSMWGWSWWLFVGAVAWAIVTWIVMCFAFCCGGRREKY